MRSAPSMLFCWASLDAGASRPQEALGQGGTPAGLAPCRVSIEGSLSALTLLAAKSKK